MNGQEERHVRSAEAIRFGYRLIGRGWSEATIAKGDQTVTLYASYLSDAIGDLTEALVAILRSADRMTVAWADEPGEYRWILEKEASRLQIKILRFEETFSRRRDEAGELVFESECELSRFAAQLRGQLRQILNELGADGYKAQWVNHDFPMSAYQQLVELTHKRA